MQCKKCKFYSDENDFCIKIDYSPCGCGMHKKVCPHFEEGSKTAEVIIGEIETRLMVERGWIS